MPSNFQVPEWLARFFDGFGRFGSAPARGWVGGLYWIAVLLTVSVFLSVGWKLTDQTNQDSLGSDQGAYLGLAARMSDAWTPFATDGTRNGLASWAAAKCYDPASPEFFLQAKRLGVLVGAAATLLLAAWLAGSLPALAAWNVTTASSLGAFLGMASYFGGEVWLYPLFFAVWVLLLATLTRPGLLYGMLLGAAAGLSYLAKPSVEPALVLFVAVSLLLVWVSRVVPHFSSHWLVAPSWKAGAAVKGLIGFVLLFLVVISPRMIDSSAQFGNPLYNLSRYTFWLDDWDSGYHHLGNFHPDRIHLVDERIRPTPAAFWQRHGWTGSWQRISQGVSLRLGQLFLPEKRIRLFQEKLEEGKRRILLTNRGVYLMLAWGCAGLAVLAALALRNFPPAGLWLVPAGFVVLLLLGYLLAFGWFAPVGPGYRFPMMFYLPLLWTGFLVADRLRLWLGWGPLGVVLAGVHVFVTILLVDRLVRLAFTSQFGEIRFTF